MNGSKNFSEDVRRPSRSRDERESDRGALAGRNYRAPTMRLMYLTGNPSVSVAAPSAPTVVAPPRAERTVSDVNRVRAVVDQIRENGVMFLWCPERDHLGRGEAVLFAHASDFAFDERYIVAGMTVECSVQAPRNVGDGRPVRSVAVDVEIAAEPLAIERQGVVVSHGRDSDTKNGWLKLPDETLAYFYNRLGLPVGTAVSAWVFDAPRGKRATGVRAL